MTSPFQNIAGIGAVRIGGVSYLHGDPSINFADGFTVDASQRFAIREL